ncbi:hypothetical protein CR513_46419, partial [Mucuna pruriens]
MEVSNLVAKLKLLKLELDEDLIVHLVLISLYVHFGKFKVSYNTQKDKWSLLWRDKMENVHFASISQNKKRKNVKDVAKGSSKGKKPKKNKKFTCFFYKKSGHMKKQCPKYARKGCLWNRPPSDDERFIFVGDDNKVVVEAIGTFRYGYLYLIHEKFQSLDVFKSFKTEVELQLGKKIKVAKFDCGGEYYGRYVGLREQPPRLFALFLKKSFFEMGNARILKEVEFRKEKNIRNVVFEEEFFNDIDQVFVPITVQETTSVIRDNVQTIVPYIVPKQDYDRVLPQILIEQPQQPQEMSLRRFIRKRRHAIPDDYIVFLQEHEDDSINFCQAMQSSNSQKWIDAIKDELKSMQDNDVWDLIELPEGVKPIGYKLIFKTKKDFKGNIERYKARLVTKGFT